MKAHKGNILEYKTYSYLKVNETDVAARESAGKEKAEGHPVFDSYKYGISPEMIQLHDNHATLYRNLTAEGKVDLGIESVVGDEDEVITIDLTVEEEGHMTGCFRSKKTGGYRSFMSRIHVKKNGVARLYFVNVDQAEVDNYLSVAAILEEGAKLDAYVFHLGDGNETSNVKCFLKGEGALGNMQSIYLGKKGQAYDFIYDMIHEGKDTTSNLIVDGALMEDSYKVFKSRIDFLEGSKHSRGNEEEFAILLDSTARSISVPALLSHEDDVEGNHAASAGRLDQDMLYYFLTRGFDAQTAERMIIDAKFAPVIDGVVYEEERKAIYEELERIMGRRDHVTK